MTLCEQLRENPDSHARNARIRIVIFCHTRKWWIRNPFPPVDPFLKYNPEFLGYAYTLSGIERPDSETGVILQEMLLFPEGARFKRQSAPIRPI